MPINADGLDGYEIQETIGRGGFATVHRAFDTRHNRNVAIKVINGRLDGDEQRRFDRERQAIGQLANHPNVVPVFESGYSPDGEAYMVLEYESGGAFSDRLAASGPLAVTEAIRHVEAVAGAVEAAHRLGIRHRDIKPENILIDEYGIPKLTDFGIASVSSGATTTGVASATLAHCAPETLDGVKPTDAVDIYSLASTFHQLVSGSPAFVRPDEEGLGGLVRRVLTDAPASLEPFGVSAPVDAVIKQAMAKRPEDRQASMSQFRSQLSAAAAGQAPIGGKVANTGPVASVGPPTIAFDGSVLPIESTPRPAPEPAIQTSSAIPNEPPVPASPPPHQTVPTTPAQPTVQPAVQPTTVQPAVQPTTVQPAVQPTTVQPAVQPTTVHAPPPADEPKSRGWLVLIPVLLVLAIAGGVLFAVLRPEGSDVATPTESTATTSEAQPSSSETANTETTPPEGSPTTEAEVATPRPPGSSNTTDGTATSEPPTGTETEVFLMPSGNILCVVSTAAATCEIIERTWTAPAQPSCDLDSDNALYVTTDEVGFLCAGDTSFGIPAETLDYGSSVTVGEFSCLSERTGVTCRNGSDLGFSLARARYELLGVDEPEPRQTLGAASCSPGGSIVFGGSTNRFDILLCETMSGELEYHGTEPAKDLEIRLSACQMGEGRWRAENEGFLYLLTSDGTVSGTTIQVINPDDEEILFETFTSIVGDRAFRLEYDC